MKRFYGDCLATRINKFNLKALLVTVNHSNCANVTTY